MDIHGTELSASLTRSPLLETYNGSGSANPLYSPGLGGNQGSDYLQAKLNTGKISNSFVKKLYSILESNTHSASISWNFYGTSFLINDITLFSSEVLPLYFKHSNFSSFVRQLNMYGFHKVNKNLRGTRKGSLEGQIMEFSHPKFLRGNSEALNEIRRKGSDDSRRELENDLKPFALFARNPYDPNAKLDMIMQEIEYFKSEQAVLKEMSKYFYRKLHPNDNFETFEFHMRNETMVKSLPSVVIASIDDTSNEFEIKKSNSFSAPLDLRSLNDIGIQKFGLSNSSYTIKEAQLSLPKETPRLAPLSQGLQSSDSEQSQQPFFSSPRSNSIENSEVNNVLQRLRLHTHSRQSSNEGA